MKIPRAARAGLLLGGAAGGIALQLMAGCPPGNMLWSAAFDAAHIPLYGLVAVAVLYALSVFAPRPGRRAGWDYAMAFVAAAVLGALTELIQALGLGDADTLDFMRDLIGACAFLITAAAFDHRVLPRSPLTRARRRALALLAVALLAAAALPLTTLAAAYLQRNAAFPLIADFSGRWERRFVHTRGAQLEIATPPAAWGREAWDQAARITYAPGDYPALLITEPFPDWRGYDRLVIDVYSELDSPSALAVGIQDASHSGDHTDRFTMRAEILPGPNRISIPLADIEHAPRGRPMDLGRIHGMTIFALRPRTALTLWVDAIRVERK